MPACTTTSILSEVYGALTWEHAVPRHAPAEAAEAVRLLVEPPSAIVVLMSGIAVALLTLTLAAKYQLTARRVHDARHAATALVAGITAVYTYDIEDWQVFEADGLYIVGLPTTMARIAQRATKQRARRALQREADCFPHWRSRAQSISAPGAQENAREADIQPRRAGHPTMTGRRGQPQHAAVGRGMARLRRVLAPSKVVTAVGDAWSVPRHDRALSRGAIGQGSGQPLPLPGPVVPGGGHQQARADAGAEGERHPRPHARLLPIS